MDEYDTLRLVHILTAFLLVAGIVGRNVSSGQAAKTDDIDELRGMMKVTDRLDVLLVRPGSFLVLIAGLVTAWRQGWPVLGFIEGGAADWVLASLAIYLSVLVLVPAVFIPRGKAFGAALERAYLEGSITSELRAAMHDPVVFAAHAYELAALVAIIFLMVVKPF